MARQHKRRKRLDHDQLLQDYDQADGQCRQQTTHVFEGPVSQDDVFYQKEQLQSLDEHGRAHVIEHIGVRTCDFGHTLGPNNPIISQCWIGGEFTCKNFCSFTCSYCGGSCCRRHSKLYRLQGTEGKASVEVYCVRHWWVYYLRHYPLHIAFAALAVLCTALFGVVVTAVVGFIAFAVWSNIRSGGS